MPPEVVEQRRDGLPGGCAAKRECACREDLGPAAGLVVRHLRGQVWPVEISYLGKDSGLRRRAGSRRIDFYPEPPCWRSVPGEARSIHKPSAPEQPRRSGGVDDDERSLALTSIIGAVLDADKCCLRPAEVAPLSAVERRTPIRLALSAGHQSYSPRDEAHNSRGPRCPRSSRGARAAICTFVHAGG
jgi:hypothetical protein